MALDPVTAALDIGGKVIDRLWPNPADAAAAKLELLKLQQSGELAQIGVNQEEAKSSSVFVSGWRPAIGWICGTACAWNWIGLPVCKLLMAMFNHPLNISPADLGEMMPVLMGMLGLGGLRTIEKLNGVASQ
jgi:hypothetical protein